MGFVQSFTDISLDTGNGANDIEEYINVVNLTDSPKIDISKLNLSSGDRLEIDLQIELKIDSIKKIISKTIPINVVNSYYYTETFDNGNYDVWAVSSGNWQVNNGELHQESSSNNREIYYNVSLPKDSKIVWEFEIMQEETYYGKSVYIYNVSDTQESLKINFDNANSTRYPISLISYDENGNGNKIAEVTNQGKNTWRTVRVEFDGIDKWDLYVDDKFIGSDNYTPSKNADEFYTIGASDCTNYENHINIQILYHIYKIV